MISHFDRRHAVELIDEAVCAILELSARTYQRWTQDVAVLSDARPSADTVQQTQFEEHHPCGETARHSVVCHRVRLCPSWPMRDVLASNRVLREAEQQHHRGIKHHNTSPSTHCASGPNQYHLAAGTGPWSVLLPLPDLYSRKIVAWEVRVRPVSWPRN